MKRGRIVICITQELIEDLFATGFGIGRPDGWPDDTTLIDIHRPWGNPASVFKFVFESEDFPVGSPGEIYPLYQIETTKAKLKKV